MLAYIFWHWPQPQIAAEEYKERLVDYHETLQQVGAPGFLYSVVFEFEGARWLNTSSQAYADWYLMGSSTTLDLLNERAVSEKCLEAHNRVAQYSQDGTAGLYHLQLGTLSRRRALYEVWFSKPDGMRYDELYRLLEPLTGQSRVNLWQRHMTLGPATEFCLTSIERQELPEGLSGVYLQVNRIWARE